MKKPQIVFFSKTNILLVLFIISIYTSKAELCTETWRPCIYDENNTLMECNTTDMSLMFYNVNDWTEIGNISNWNTSCITNMALMFHNSNFNQDISNWDVSNVKNMYGMFFNAVSFNQNISKWNISNVTDTRYMFSGAVSFNQSLNDWDVSNVEDMSYMFSGAVSFNQPLDGWDVSNVKSMEGMFKGTTTFNNNITTWKTSALKNTNSMFYDAVSFNQSLNDWDVSNVEDMSYMFSGAVSFNQPLDGWDVSNVKSMEGMFKGAKNFNNSLNEWNTASLENIAYMFEDATSFNQNLNSWDTSKIKYMIFTFKNAISFNGNISNWETGNVLNMYGMFSGAVSFNQSLNDWDVSNVEDMCEIFSGAVSFNQPLNRWNTSKVWCVSKMFFNAVSFNQSLNDWDVSNVEDFSFMFACDYDGCEYSFNGDISSWNTSKAADMSAMFFNAKNFNQDISNWDVSKVETMNSMFFNAVSFNQNISKWNVYSLNDANNMFFNVTLSTSIYDSILETWSDLELKYDVPFDAGYSTYTEDAIDAREKLITYFNWAISDGGQYILCTENWVRENISCNGTIGFYMITYFDNNLCNTTNTLPADNGTVIYCCVEDWFLKKSECINNIFTIEYYDLNNCNTTYTIPYDNGTIRPCDHGTSKYGSKNFEKKSEVCIYDENYDWKCSEWGPCINGRQHRVCLEKNNCGTSRGRPEVERECVFKTDSADKNTDDIYVKKDKALFDILLDILKEPYENEDMPVKITLINFGKSGLINVNLTYIVYDVNENIVFFEKKEDVVDTQKEFIKQVPLKNIISGKYYLKVILEYPDQEYPAHAQKNFNVKNKTNIENMFLFLSSSFVVFFVLVYAVIKKFKPNFFKNFLKKENLENKKDNSFNNPYDKSINNESANNMSETATSQQLLKITLDAPSGKEFFLKGKIIKNLKELLSELYSMDESCFREYVNEYKNDFANWIGDVFMRKDVAQKIINIRSKDELISILKGYT